MRKLAVVLVMMVLVTGCAKMPVVLKQTQSANHSSGSYWECELSDDSVLVQKDYYETSFLGPGYRQHWEFEVIGEGTVTIFWKAYNSGTDFDAKHSYYAVYTAGEGGIVFIGERAYTEETRDTEAT